MITNKTDTVIFDLDGTLVDSQPAALGATIKALSQFGVQVTADEVREVFGGGAKNLLRHFLERDLGADEASQARHANCLGATPVLPMAALTLQEVVERGIALARSGGERSRGDRTDRERSDDSNQDPPVSSCFNAIPAMTATEQV